MTYTYPKIPTKTTQYTVTYPHQSADMIANQSVSTLLVDDDPLFRKGIQTLLSFYSKSGTSQLNVVGEAASVNQAIKLAEEQHPALILLDIELPHEDGITALIRLREHAYQGKVIVLSAHREDEWVFRSMQAGASGYLFKDCLANQLCNAITTVIQNNEVFLSPEVATGFFRMFHFYAGHSLQVAQSLHLTEREQEVLHWLVQGASNEKIAQNLYITVATVKAHLTAIFEKLKVNSRTQAIVKALKIGIVSA